jgi:biotin carboxyl carrier protein
MFQAKVNQGENFTIEKKEETILLDGKEFKMDLSEITKGYFHILKDNVSITAEVVSADVEHKTFQIKVNGNIHEVTLKGKIDLLLDKMGISSQDDNTLKDIKAPMPGLILDILVSVGDEISKGNQLMILEAMKMENVLKATGDGIVKAIEVVKGQSVEKNQVLINF